MSKILEFSFLASYIYCILHIAGETEAQMSNLHSHCATTPRYLNRVISLWLIILKILFFNKNNYILIKFVEWEIFFRNQAEMAHTCRGTISLLGALIHTADSCTFVISNGGTQTFHIRAHDEVERQSWVTALELAKAKAM